MQVDTGDSARIERVFKKEPVRRQEFRKRNVLEALVGHQMPRKVAQLLPFMVPNRVSRCATFHSTRTNCTASSVADNISCTTLLGTCGCLSCQVAAACIAAYTRAQAVLWRITFVLDCLNRSDELPTHSAGRSTALNRTC